MSLASVARVLVVDDDERFRERVVRALQERAFEAEGAGDTASALKRAEHGGFTHALIDLRMPDRDGLELLRQLRALDPTLQAVVLTGYGSIATAVEAMRRGALHYLTKPVEMDEIVAALRRDRRATGPAPAAEDEVPSLARTEWEHIQRVLTDCGGNVSEAARRLGLHRRSLQRKLSKYPVRR